MSTFLLTIAVSDRRVEMVLPSETPIGGLMSTVVELAAPDAGSEPPGEWSIALEDGSRLAPQRSFSDNGVPDGAVLRLQPPEPSPPAPDPSAAEPPAPPALSSPRPAVPRSGLLERVRDAVAPRSDHSELDASIRAPRLATCATVAVVSADEGAGKTTVAALLGSLLAHLRDDRTVVVDYAPGDRSLGSLLAPGHGLYTDDLLDLLAGSELTTRQVDVHLGRAAHGLRVLADPPDPARLATLDRHAHILAVEALKQHGGMIVLDCPPGLQAPATQAAITTSDQVVLVTDSDTAAITSAADAARRLVRSRSPFMLVVNRFPRRGSRIDLDALATNVPETDGILAVRTDTRGAARLSARHLSWDDAPEPWATDARRLAACLLEQWPGLGLSPELG